MKKIIAILFFQIIMLTAYAQTPTPPSGSGTLVDPYKIENLNNLYWIAENSARWASNYIQIADINAAATSSWFSGAGWTPIGNSTTQFTGTYDGQNYTITGLFINRALTNYIGLFGYTNGALIASLHLTSVSITGHDVVGGLVGYNYSSTISNCSSSGAIIGYDNGVGGLVGSNGSTSTISNCYSTGSVTGTVFDIGGLVGHNNWSSITSSYSTASVTGSASVGGLVGWNTNLATIANSYATGTVTGTSSPGSVGEKQVGGLVGVDDGNATISKSYSTGVVTGSHVDHGGLVGSSGSLGNVTNSFWDTESSLKANSNGGTGKSTAQMKTQSTFTGSGWDFLYEIANGTNDYWGIDASLNNGYPYLNFTKTSPYVQNFDGVTAPTLPYGWYVENTNEDSKQWANTTFFTHSGLNSMQYSYSNTDAADDWLFSTGFNLAEGITYEVTFWYKKESFGSEKLEVKYGLSQTAASMTSAAIFSDENITSDTYTKGTGTITVLSSGIYYIGWHCFSLANQGDLYLDDISIRVQPAASITLTIPGSSVDPLVYTGTGATLQFTIANNDPLDLTIATIVSSPGGTPPDGLTNIADHYWTVTVNSGGVNGTYSISFDVADVAGVLNLATLHLLKRDDAIGIWTDYGVASSISGTLLTWTGFTSFSEFGLGGDDANPLPVELTSFTASVLESKVILNWQTATEVNNYGFEVERTSPRPSPQGEGGEAGRGWEKIGFVQGHGNSNSVKEYSFTDKPNGGTKFKYRLKQIDNDGKYEYSKEIEIDLGMPNEFSLSQNYPNPFNPSTTIRYSIPGNVVETLHATSLRVFDILGNVVATLVNENKSAGNYEVKYDASNLSSGIYFYKLQSGSFVQTKKFILIK